MTTELFFDELPKSFLDEVRRRNTRIMQRRAGGIFTTEFEDGMKFVYAQILQDLATENKIIETYTKLRSSYFNEANLRRELANYFFELDRKNASSSSVLERKEEV